MKPYFIKGENMDSQAFSQLISSVGFPIVACMIMWKSLQDSTAAHKQEIDGMKESLNQNTLVLSELKQMLKDFKESLAGGKGTDE